MHVISRDTVNRAPVNRGITVYILLQMIRNLTDYLHLRSPTQFLDLINTPTSWLEKSKSVTLFFGRVSVDSYPIVQ